MVVEAVARKGQTRGQEAGYIRKPNTNPNTDTDMKIQIIHLYNQCEEVNPKSDVKQQLRFS